MSQRDPLGSDVATRRSSAASTRKAGWPGLGVSIASAVLAGSAMFGWGMPRLLGAGSEDASPTAGSSALAAVATSELSDAVSTMDVPAAVRTKTEDRRRCPVLATVTLSPGTGGPAKVRVRSGRYMSPIYAVGAVPVRIGIPYPAPYRTGRGTLLVYDEGGSAIVSLTPPWTVHEAASPSEQQVHWTPAPPCPASGAD